MNAGQRFLETHDSLENSNHGVKDGGHLGVSKQRQSRRGSNDDVEECIRQCISNRRQMAPASAVAPSRHRRYTPTAGQRSMFTPQDDEDSDNDEEEIESSSSIVRAVPTVGPIRTRVSGRAPGVIPTNSRFAGGSIDVIPTRRRFNGGTPSMRPMRSRLFADDYSDSNDGETKMPRSTYSKAPANRMPFTKSAANKEEVELRVINPRLLLPRRNFFAGDVSNAEGSPPGNRSGSRARGHSSRSHLEKSPSINTVSPQGSIFLTPSPVVSTLGSRSDLARPSSLPVRSHFASRTTSSPTMRSLSRMAASHAQRQRVTPAINLVAKPLSIYRDRPSIRVVSSQNVREHKPRGAASIVLYDSGELSTASFHGDGSEADTSVDEDTTDHISAYREGVPVHSGVSYLKVKTLPPARRASSRDRRNSRALLRVASRTGRPSHVSRICRRSLSRVSAPLSRRSGVVKKRSRRRSQVRSPPHTASCCCSCCCCCTSNCTVPGRHSRYSSSCRRRKKKVKACPAPKRRLRYENVRRPRGRSRSRSRSRTSSRRYCPRKWRSRHKLGNAIPSVSTISVASAVVIPICSDTSMSARVSTSPRRHVVCHVKRE